MEEGQRSYRVSFLVSRKEYNKWIRDIPVTWHEKLLRSCASNWKRRLPLWNPTLAHLPLMCAAEKVSRVLPSLSIHIYNFSYFLKSIRKRERETCLSNVYDSYLISRVTLRILFDLRGNGKMYFFLYVTRNIYIYIYL